jgi:hypothetical protein
MTVQQSKKAKEIEVWRKNKFNPFPMRGKSKGADSRYDAENTKPNQVIEESENWGVIGTVDGKNGTLDLDDKEIFRPFAENMKKKGYKVIESPHGWHIPFINIGNNFKKTNLFNKTINPDKQCVEIMTHETYVVGVGSLVHEDKKDPQSELVTYKNVGSNKFWDLNGMESGDFIDYICKECNVELADKPNSSQNQNLRIAFTERKIPTGNSNNYFIEAARVCYWREELDRDEAYTEIKKIYDEWKASEYFTYRSWNNCKVKIDTVYDNPKKWEIRSGKRIGKGKEDIDRTGIALKILKEREFFSDKALKNIYENKGGYLELVDHILPSELFVMNPKLERADTSEIISKIMLGANDMPPTNKNLIVFKNGIFDIRLGKMVESDEIADMGFPEYNWLPRTKVNEPKMFLKFFDSYPKEELPRFYAGMKGIFDGYVDSRITVLVGISRVGKTTITSIICKAITKRYGFSCDLDTFLDDRATASKINGKRLFVIQDLPETWKSFALIKNITGESQTSIREFGKSLDENAENKIKIFATANEIPPIKDSAKNAMYSDRLSLVHNIETKMFKADKRLEDKVLEAEAEKIISWIVNIPDKECEYEDGEIVRKQWEELANPQFDWIGKNYVIGVDTSNLDERLPVKTLCDLFKANDPKSRKMSIDRMTDALKEIGYSVKSNVIMGIKDKPKSNSLSKKEKTEHDNTMKSSQ